MEWVKEFLNGQGVVVDSTIFYQDNTSTMTMMKDPSCGKLRTRYMKARLWVANEFLFVRNEAEVTHLDTDFMIANCLTKPLGGRNV